MLVEVDTVCVGYRQCWLRWILCWIPSVLVEVDTVCVG